MTITLSFEPKDLDYIANVLSRQPWVEVNTLLVNIQKQVQEQQNVVSDATPRSPTGYDASPGRSAPAGPNGSQHYAAGTSGPGG